MHEDEQKYAAIRKNDLSRVEGKKICHRHFLLNDGEVLLNFEFREEVHFTM